MLVISIIVLFRSSLECKEAELKNVVLTTRKKVGKCVLYLNSAKYCREIRSAILSQQKNNCMGNHILKISGEHSAANQWDHFSCSNAFKKGTTPLITNETSLIASILPELPSPKSKRTDKINFNSSEAAFPRYKKATSKSVIRRDVYYLCFAFFRLSRAALFSCNI